MPLNDVVLFGLDFQVGEYLKWSPPDVQNAGAWEGLAHVLIEYRKWLRGEREKSRRALDTLGDISNDGLRNLIAAAYRASFLRDEGRPVTARLVVRPPLDGAEPPPVDHEDALQPVALRLLTRTIAPLALEVRKRREERETVYRFPPGQVPVEHKTIARLSTTLRPEDAALVVAEQAGKLHIAGTMLLGFDGTGHRIVDPYWTRTRDCGLVVEIVGPGHLRVIEGKGEYTLSADRLIQHQSVARLGLVSSWLCELSETLVERSRIEGSLDTEDGVTLAYLEQAEQAKELRLIPHYGVEETWSGILGEAIRLGHGGAFVILPDPTSAPVKTEKFEVERFDLGAEIIRAWVARKNIESSHAPRGLSPGWLWPEVQDWRAKVQAVGALSATDGCVVFDRRLVLHAFGGSIDANRTGPELRPCVDLTSNALIARAELLARGGERHASAYYLCHQVPHSLVFVVSQDGDLKLFASTDSHVCFAAGLRP